jgi:hypothetical protein
MKIASSIAILVAAFCFSTAASANTRGIIHKVTDKGETYEDLAEHYYGKRYLALHLRLFNLRAEPLAKGTTIIIPTYTIVSVKPRQTLTQFAQQNLADPGRAEYVAELHGLRGKERTQPRPGTKLRVVQSLKHLVRPGESLKTIARIYYRDGGPERLKLLVLYNKLTSQDVRPGMSLRIPLDEREFAAATVAARARRTFAIGSSAVAEVKDRERPRETPPAKVAVKKPPAKRPDKPAEKDGELPEGDPEATAEEENPEAVAAAAPSADPLESLDRLCGDGDYTACEAQATKVFGEMPAGQISSRAEVLRLRAVALVALGKVEEAKTTFRKLLELDPEYDLDLYRTSPKILDVFQAVAER